MSNGDRTVFAAWFQQYDQFRDYCDKAGGVRSDEFVTTFCGTCIEVASICEHKGIDSTKLLELAARLSVYNGRGWVAMSEVGGTQVFFSCWAIVKRGQLRVGLPSLNPDVRYSYGGLAKELQVSTPTLRKYAEAVNLEVPDGPGAGKSLTYSHEEVFRLLTHITESSATSSLKQIAADKLATM